MADHEIILRILQVLSDGFAYSLTDLSERSHADPQSVRNAVQTLVRDGRATVQEVMERHQYRAVALPVDRPRFSPSFQAGQTAAAIADWVRIFGVPDGLQRACAERILEIIAQYQKRRDYGSYARINRPYMTAGIMIPTGAVGKVIEVADDSCVLSFPSFQNVVARIREADLTDPE